MTDFIYSSDSIEKAAPGISLKTMNNWAGKSEWFTPLEPFPGRGKARRFSRLNAIEAALVNEMMRMGLTRRNATQAMGSRANSRKGPGFGADPAAFAKLSEVTKKGIDWHWLVYLDSNSPEIGDNNFVVGTRAFQFEQAQEMFSLYKDTSFFHIAVSDIIARVDKVLANEAAD